MYLFKFCIWLYIAMVLLLQFERLFWCSLDIFIFGFVASLDIILSLNAWRSLKVTQILRYLLKFVVAAAWALVLPIGYSSSVLNPTGLVKFFSTWSMDWQNQSFYIYAVAIYLIPNVLAALLFVLPPLRRTMERSNWRIVTLIMWWAQASISSTLTFDLSVCVHACVLGLVDILVFVSFSSTQPSFLHFFYRSAAKTIFRKRHA